MKYHCVDLLIMHMRLNFQQINHTAINVYISFFFLFFLFVFSICFCLKKNNLNKNLEARAV